MDSSCVVASWASFLRCLAILAFLQAGIILEYELRDRSREMKEIDLLHLSPE